MGYRWNFRLDTGYDLVDNPSERDTDFQYFSALPLLCYFKIYLDYYIPSQLQPSSHIHELFHFTNELVASEINVTDWSKYHLSPYEDQDNLILSAFYEMGYYYQNNYFTSAWQTPNSVVSGLQNIGTTSFDRPVINSINGQSNQDIPTVSQPLLNNYTGVFPSESSAFSSDGLSFLQKFARFVKRSNFAGSRSVERLLARFGVRVDDFNLGMCRYLGSDHVQVEISDVTVNGNTEQAGDLAGKSWAAGNGNRTFKCDCDLAGYIIFTSSIVTPSVPVRGIRRRMLHLQPLDYYTPELDGSQMQAISMSELYSNDKFATYGFAPFGVQRVLGYSPRFSEYKGMSIDDVTGDFDIFTLNSNIDPYILPRRIIDELGLYNALIVSNDPTDIVNDDYIFKSEHYAYNDPLALSPTKLLQGSDMYQFNRIFKDTSGFADPFIVDFDINCVINGVALPLNESAEIVGKGKNLDFETNGKHL